CCTRTPPPFRKKTVGFTSIHSTLPVSAGWNATPKIDMPLSAVLAALPVISTHTNKAIEP
ncbi:hypothetical protein, partial [Listeria monocytogenes]|uniref:hypothetical protein n=1 Tax=Listeria monocytogenes TaxID=1639 RepID=UPI001968B184